MPFQTVVDGIWRACLDDPISASLIIGFLLHLSDILIGKRISGFGNLIFGGTLWTIADLACGEHLGYLLFLTAQSPSNDTRALQSATVIMIAS